MTRTTTAQKRQAKARQRRRRTAQARLRREQAPAQRAAEARPPALQALDLPETLIAELAGRVRRQPQRLGKLFGLRFPALFGCRTTADLCRVRGWDKHLPSRLLGALPQRSWLKRRRRLGLDVLRPLWRRVQDQSPATRSRWPWTGVADDAVFKQYGQHLALVGTWWRGQENRVRPGIDGGLWVVVIGDGKGVVPVDCAMRRPAPQGPGAPGRDQRSWVQGRLEERLAALGRRGLRLPAPLVGAERWDGDSKLMRPVSAQHQGTFWVEGKHASVLT